MQTVRPMIHVPDVRKTVAWYAEIGFTVINTYEDDGVMSWAMLGFGEGAFMLNEGGASSSADRREVDLYVTTDDVDRLFETLKERVEILQPPYNAFHGNREFIVRDCNGFWITFAQPIDQS